MLQLSWYHFFHMETALAQARQMPLWGHQSSSCSHLHDTRCKVVLAACDPQRMIPLVYSLKQV